MPTFSFTESSALDALIVESTMLYPNDASLRDRYLLVQRTRLAERTRGAEGALTLEEAKCLWDEPSRDEIERLAAVEMRRAMLAGDQLLRIKADHDLDRPGASKRRARQELREELISGLRSEAGGALNYGETTLKGAMRDFRPVLHLWAVWEYFENNPPPRITIEPARYQLRSVLPLFIAIAEQIREFAESWENADQNQPKRHPLMVAGEAWVPPKSFALPGVGLSYSIEDREWRDRPAARSNRNRKKGTS